MSTFRLAIMLMKTQELKHSCHYVNENKGARSFHESALRPAPLNPGLFNRFFLHPCPLSVRAGSARGSAGLWRAPKTAKRVDCSRVSWAIFDRRTQLSFS